MARFDLKGVPVAPGVGIGPAFVAVEPGLEDIPRRTIRPDQVERALARFEAARRRAIQGLRRIQTATARELGIQDAAIYAAQVAVLEDPDALREIRRLVREEHLEPESAIQQLLNRFRELFEGLEGGEMKNWAADLRDPWFAVLRALNQEEEQTVGAGRGDRRLVVVAEELTPSLVTRFPRSDVAAFVCARGGRFSHGAVLARSFGVPTVIGLDDIHARVQTGEPCVVYGDEGRVLVGADPEQQEEARVFAREREEVRATFAAAAREPVRTLDGTLVQVLVNIESPRDLQTFDPATADGVGLFRTEFAYMEQPKFPGEQEQAEIYCSVLESFPGRPVVFRTLDIGGDKPLRYFQTPRERNPGLGWRGIRVSLEWRDLFLMQLAALRTARAHGDVRVLLPMVTTVEELAESRRLVEQLCRDAGDGACELPLGAMIEVPAAAMAMKEIAAEADFVSVGTNDLTQYLFAVDRDNPWVANLYQPFHPAHLRVLRHIARTSARAGRPASVCGEMAGQAAGALYLVGAGFRQLSTAPPFVPEIKALLRRVRVAELERLAARAARSRTASEAQGLLEEAAARAWREVVREARQRPARRR